MDQPVPQYVGFWARFLAFVIDSVLMCLVLAPLAWLMWGEGATAALLDPANAGSNALQLGVSIAVFLGAWVVTSSDPGKQVVSAVIVDATTLQKPTTVKFVVRYLAYYLSLICLGLGFLWIAFDARKQGWHDKIAGTVVIKKG